MKVFGIPLLLAGMASVGLVSALLGDGLWDAVSWLGLGTPLAAIAFFWLRAAYGRIRG